VIAESDDRRTGAQQADGDLGGDPPPSRGILAVDDDEVDTALLAEFWQALDDRLAAGLADDVAKEEESENLWVWSVDNASNWSVMAGESSQYSSRLTFRKTECGRGDGYPADLTSIAKIPIAVTLIDPHFHFLPKTVERPANPHQDTESLVLVNHLHLRLANPLGILIPLDLEPRTSGHLDHGDNHSTRFARGFPVAEQVSDLFVVTNGHLRKPHAGWSLIKSPLSSLLKRPLSPDSLAFIASPTGIFSAPHFHSRFPEVP
jgi:hypothetical protein